MNIVELKVTDKELNNLYAGVIKNTTEYLEQTDEPYLTIDAIELYVLRKQLDEAQKLLDKMAEQDRLRFFPEGLVMRAS